MKAFFMIGISINEVKRMKNYKRATVSFCGLIMGRNDQSGNLLDAIKKGECKTVSYVKNSEILELMQLEADLVQAVIESGKRA
jgi:hypothetical protein